MAIARPAVTDVFLQKHLFDPLDMRDTGFHVPAEKKGRFSVVYGKAGVLLPVEPVAGSKFLGKPKHLSGGSGLVSTIRDTGDAGTPQVLQHPDSDVSRELKRMAEEVAARISVLAHTRTAETGGPPH